MVVETPLRDKIQDYCKLLPIISSMYQMDRFKLLFKCANKMILYFVFFSILRETKNVFILQ